MIRSQLLFSLATFKVEKNKTRVCKHASSFVNCEKCLKPELVLLVLSGQEAGTVKCFVFVEEKLN